MKIKILFIQFLFFSNSLMLLLAISKANLKKSEVKSMNPDQPASASGGGDSGEFLRRDQPQEHIIIPLINELEGDYNPYVAPDIKKFRKEKTKLDDDIKFKFKLDKQRAEYMSKDFRLVNNEKLDKYIDSKILDIFKPLKGA